MYYTIPQVAAMRLCRKTTVHHAILERRLPAWTIGGIYLIPREDAEAWALRPGHPSASARDNATARKLARLQRAAARRSFEQDGHEAAPRADAIYEEPPCATE
jgi:excisionase family DNA binding protein